MQTQIREEKFSKMDKILIGVIALTGGVSVATAYMLFPLGQESELFEILRETPKLYSGLVRTLQVSTIANLSLSFHLATKYVFDRIQNK